VLYHRGDFAAPSLLKETAAPTQVGARQDLAIHDYDQEWSPHYGPSRHVTPAKGAKSNAMESKDASSAPTWI
jgi:hypothetical protein